MSKSKIQWTDKVWNPIRGCARVSPGCESCYAERQAHRFSGPRQPYEGLTVLTQKGTPRWRGNAVFIASMLDAPLRWKKPVRVFVNSMSDLFHEDIPNEDIAAIFGVMAACPQHTFQVLTKRPARMKAWFAWLRAWDRDPCGPPATVICGTEAANRGADVDYLGLPGAWPLPNVWLGVSCEDQQRADERIPALLDTPAAVRFISAEPLLGPIDLARYLKPTLIAHDGERLQHPDPRVPHTGGDWQWGLNWVIVGGESGPNARACARDWITRVMLDCQHAKVPVFVKQLGAKYQDVLNGIGGAQCKPDSQIVTIRNLRDNKGGDPREWPAELRVRAYPGHAGGEP